MGTYLSGNRMFPDTATGGQGGVSAGLAPSRLWERWDGCGNADAHRGRQVADASQEAGWGIWGREQMCLKDSDTTQVWQVSPRRHAHF